MEREPRYPVGKVGNVGCVGRFAWLDVASGGKRQSGEQVCLSAYRMYCYQDYLVVEAAKRGGKNGDQSRLLMKSYLQA